ncbi:GNAT family N-acetyltransferase [Candidatus Solirubrobacter pratensis]|uniref:GNAT family N-acetyltransferase n=1 Tax=Candidatus Solirubrobacter pratensis TaxID=1298857 RepID=UPI0009DBD696
MCSATSTTAYGSSGSRRLPATRRPSAPRAREAAQPTEWWERWAAQSELGTSQRTFVLEADKGRWLGLTLVRLDDERPGWAVLNAMWVAPEAGGRRAAGLLCEACAAWAAERGSRQLTLKVVVGNEAARRAYEAAGFAVCGESTWVRDGRTVDQLVMARSLSHPSPA